MVIPTYKNILDLVMQEYGKQSFQMTRRLFVLHGNLSKQRCHLYFNHRCKNKNLLPQSLRIRPPVRSKKGYDTARRFGFAFLSLRITENHAMLKKYQREIQVIEESLISSFHDRLWRHVKRELQHHSNHVTNITKSKHLSSLEKLRNNSSKRSVVNQETKWVINMSSRKLSEGETSLLSKGLNFAPAPKKIPVQQIIVEVESSVYGLNPVEKSDVRNKVVSVLSSAKPPRRNLSKEETEAIRTLKNDKDIVILKADKGNATVVLDKSEYNNKMSTLLNDTKTYQLLPNDPAKSCEQKMKSLLAGVKDKIPANIYRKINTTDGNTPRLYGIPKIHKPGTPLRPIVSFIGSPTYELSKYLSEILSPLVGNSEYNLRKSKDWTTLASTLRVEKNED